MPKKLPIASVPEKILRKRAKDISPDDIRTPAIQGLIADMTHTLGETPNGVGLAAPQVGKSLRLFIVSEEAKEIDRIERASGARAGREAVRKDAEAEGDGYKKRDWKYYVFINPVVTNRSQKKIDRTEGCLSVPKKFGDVSRHEKITVSAFDENGRRFTRGASRFFARVIQHELDHLEGVLFIDKADNLFEETDGKSQ